jgi:ABC-type nickel/cobalt efflux system permease component RcnA
MQSGDQPSRATGATATGAYQIELSSLTPQVHHRRMGELHHHRTRDRCCGRRHLDETPRLDGGQALAQDEGPIF